MTAEPVVPVRVRCLPSQPLSPEGVLRILVCQPGRDLRGADSLRALIKFTRADTTTRSVVRQSSRRGVDTAKQTLFGVAFWRKGDSRARVVTTFQRFVGWGRSATRRPASVGGRFDVSGVAARDIVACPCPRAACKPVGRLDQAGGMSRKLRRRKDYAGAQNGPYQMSKKHHASRPRAQSVAYPSNGTYPRATTVQYGSASGSRLALGWDVIRNMSIAAYNSTDLLSLTEARSS